MFRLEDTREEELSTQRLRLRPPRRSDVEALDEAIQETLPDLIRWLPWARPNHTRQDTRIYVRGARRAYARRQAFEFLVEDAGDGAVLGVTSLHRVDWARRGAGLGYWIRHSRRGKGTATEATQAMVEFAFRVLLLHRLELHVAPENLASHRVAEKLGFQREGIARELELINGQYLDHVQYSLLRADVMGSAGGSR